MGSDRGYAWLWDLEIDDLCFERILRGEQEERGLGWKWAMARLIDYAPYREIWRLLPKDMFVERWPEVAPLVRSETRREGMEYLRERLMQRRMG